MHEDLEVLLLVISHDNRTLSNILISRTTRREKRKICGGITFLSQGIKLREKKKKERNGFCVGSATDRSRELGIITIIVSWAFGGASVTRAQGLFSVTKTLYRGRSAASCLRPLLSNPCMISYLTRGGKKERAASERQA